ncbi:MAG: alkaline phosphatase family protein [Gammaproteobacteria bacterium]|nr:alkaline phosphatase family protein [Gammaproteobacteria bacterium]
MRTTIKRVVTSLFALFIIASVPASAGAKPKLVVLITIDQLRGDMPWRFKDRFGPGGFRHLMDKGATYTNAHFQHSTTFTAVGHATLATGGNAAQHGLAGNDWHNTTTGKRVYCVEDDRHPLIGKEPKAHKGTSPRNLTSSTIGDELILSTGGKSRVFSVSIKDRGAILPGGHLGKAFWYSSGSGKFVTSTYYYEEYPEWVTAWNAEDHGGRYQNETWDLLQERAAYTFQDQDDRPFEKSYKHLGRTFPHALGNEDAKAFYAALRFTPMGDQLTLAFVKELMTQEKVGQGNAMDMLAVSFSATDYLGHAFGPNSLEAEDNLLRLDQTLAEFFQIIDQQVGLDQTLLVLASDHGTDEISEYKASLGVAAGRHRPDEFLQQANAALQARFNTTEKLVVAFWNPSLYLDPGAVTKLGVDMATVERALAEAMMKIPGFALALTRTDLMAGDVPNTATVNRVQAAFHPVRSGNVLVVQEPFWYLYPNPDQFSAMHGSPYTYDTYVPIMFAGPGIGQQRIDRPVAPRDIAPTITAYLGIKPPSGSVGTPLTEVLN